MPTVTQQRVRAEDGESANFPRLGNRYGTRFSRPLWPDCTPSRRGDGASPSWPRRLLCRAQHSTAASGNCSASRPSATSRIGGCTSPRRCSRRPRRRSSRSHAALDTSRRRRSAKRSSASMEARQASGETHSSASNPPARRCSFSTVRGGAKVWLPVFISP
jgi:hypothetical protein